MAPPFANPPLPAGRAQDVDALRGALDDAAKASGPLWVSYVLAQFYFLIAAGGVTHKDMFLERPVKLPFLGVDLPLTGFFFVAPFAFLLLHAYVLLHFAVLARKVAAFEASLQQVAGIAARLAIRRQLPSSLFIQRLAGPAELRAGLVGGLIETVFVVSLMLGPVALQAFLQLRFLPYHSGPITWAARGAVVAELALVWLLWPRLSFATPNGPPLWYARLREKARRAALFLLGLPRLCGVALHYPAWRPWRWLAACGSVAVLWLAFLIGTYPGEWLDDHAPKGWLREVLIDGSPYRIKNGYVVYEDKLVDGKPVPGKDKPIRATSYMRGIDEVSHHPTTPITNRLILMDFDIAEDPRFESQAKLDFHQVTFSLRAHDLRRAVLTNSDLRKADLTGAVLTEAMLDYANLDQTKLDNATLNGSSLNFASLRGASLNEAFLQHVSLFQTKMQGATFIRTHAQGTRFSLVDMQGAWLEQVELQGSFFDHSKFQGASFWFVQMAGSYSFNSQFQGSFFNSVDLNGALLVGNAFMGMNTSEYRLKYESGANLLSCEFAKGGGNFLWRSQWIFQQQCYAITRNGTVAPLWDGNGPIIQKQEWTRSDYDRLLRTIQNNVQVFDRRDSAITLIGKLDPYAYNGLEEDASEAWHIGLWRQYEDINVEPQDWSQWATSLSNLGCKDTNPPYLVAGLIRNYVLDPWVKIIPPVPPRAIQKLLARSFLADTCAGARGLDARTRAELKQVADEPDPPPEQAAPPAEPR